MVSSCYQLQGKINKEKQQKEETSGIINNQLKDQLTCHDPERHYQVQKQSENISKDARNLLRDHDEDEEHI